MTGFSVWAPLARNSIELALDDRSLPMMRDGDWWHLTTEAAPGDRYAFRIDGGDERPDPRSLAQPDGPHARSAVVDLRAHEWHDEDWAGRQLDGSVIYELHIGTFTPGAPSMPPSGSWITLPHWVFH
ncbi:hypothetical protein [Flexivirga alba]|uniref:Glycoside hydrolase family 13 N-terminal domain-containing protein n=1 Tax=Flexivirga alba TaxID=702742 RepID=A0ABW2AAY9_9MICO